MSGFAPLGRLLGLALICTGLGFVGLASPEPAQALGSNVPTAIGVAPDGTTYIGFRSGAKLARLNANGASKKAVPLDQDGPVVGLHVAGNQEIWVDYETSVSRINSRGKVAQSFTQSAKSNCDASPTEYGGITVGDGLVWIADRCSDTMSVYSRGGDLKASVDLPGKGAPRGIAYGSGQGARGPTVYVALPDSARIVAYSVDRIRSAAKPWRTVTLRRPYRGHTPEPGGVAVDRFGQLSVTDTANNAVYLLDSNNGFSLYRTLGHPPRASRDQGRLSNPTAIAQHAQDGGALSGNLFIADANNSRVQRWDTGGYTHWAKRVHGGSGGGGGGAGGGGTGGGGPGGGGGTGGGSGSEAPSSSSPPLITGTPAVGSPLFCNRGAWSTGASATVTYAYVWRRGGTAIFAANAATYVPVASDEGNALTCTVTARNSAGSTSATSASVIVGDGGGTGGDDRPANVTVPTISGAAAVGQTVSCSQGTWSGVGNTYAYAWRRDNAAIPAATAPTYTVSASDSGVALTCAVTATSTGGSTTATSAAVTVGSASSPTNTVPPTISGTTVLGQTLVCGQGTWSGTGNTFTYVWRRNSTSIGSATTASYVVSAADVGASLTCAVTATGAGGSSTATSAPVTVPGAPANTAVPVVSGTPRIGEPLTCSTGTWAGQTPLTYAYAWRRGATPILGATSSSYTVVGADLDTLLACVVTATNSVGSNPASSLPVSIDSPPSITSVPVINPSTGLARIGAGLSCDKGSWTGANNTYRYSWNRDGAPIPDTSSSTYVVLTADAGAALTCSVTATNTAGSATTTTNPKTVDPVAVGAPTPTVAPMISGTAATGQTLTCNRGTWAGDPPISYVTAWQRNGTAIAAGDTYTLAAADAGADLSCLVVATNAAGKGAARSAAVVGNGCGGAIGVRINSDAARTTSADVRLSIRPPTGATTVRISNSSDFTGVASMPLVDSCTYDWTMSSIAGLALDFAVYVRFGPDPTTTYQDSITVDVPSGSARR